MIQGEKRYIQFDVKSTKKEPIVITEAHYELRCKDKVIAEGEVEIADRSKMYVLVEAREKGALDLEITYTIPPEIRKVRCCIDVN